MSAVESPIGQADGADIFETGGTSGMTTAAISALPVVRFAESGGEQTVCSVCLQVTVPRFDQVECSLVPWFVLCSGF